MPFVIGDVRVTRVEEALMTTGAPKDYFPLYDEDSFRRNENWLVPDHIEPGSLRMHISMHSWLVQTRHHTILVDTCCGNCKPRPGKPRFNMLNTDYLGRLRAAGIAPEKVDYVICTHLHVDHCGWNTQLVDGRWVPTFPNAKYVMPRPEYDYWRRQVEAGALDEADRLTFEDSVQPIVEAGLAQFVDGAGAVGDNLTIHPAPGHTPGHVRIDLLSRGERAMFVGDIVMNPIQIPMPSWSGSFCIDQQLSASTRQTVMALCAERHDLLLPAHFLKPHGCYVTEKGGRFSADFSRPYA